MPDLKMLSQALRDPEYYKEIGSRLVDVANRGVVGGILGAPVDIVNTALGAFGFPVSSKPVMGSEWLGDKMQQAGMVSTNRNPIAETLAGFVDPATIGAGALKAGAALPALMGMTKVGKGERLQDVLSKAEDVPIAGDSINEFGYYHKAAEGALKAQKTEYELAHEIAQRNAALPVEQGGLGLPANNTAMDRAKALSEITKDDVLSRAHQFGDLEYTNIPISEFKGKLIYKSPSYNRKQSSEYRLGNIGGKDVYMRKSDHWGKFKTNIKEGDPIAEGVKTDDVFGRVGELAHDWELLGGATHKNKARIDELKSTYDNLPVGSNERHEALNNVFDELYKLENPKKSEAGYIALDDLIGKVPEKIAYVGGVNGYAVPVITMKNGNIRSRFAAFDPAKRNLKDIMAAATPVAVGLGALGIASMPQDANASSFQKKGIYGYK